MVCSRFRILEEKSVLCNRLLLMNFPLKRPKAPDPASNKDKHCSKKSSVGFLEEFS